MSKRLFKYKAVSEYYNEKGDKINRDIENLIAGQLWVSSLEGMNDPLECAFYIDQSLDLNEIDSFQRRLLRSYACISFSTSVLCRRLWNYYTDGMRGMVIEYSDSSIRAALKRSEIYSIQYDDIVTSSLFLEGQIRKRKATLLSLDGETCISFADNNKLNVWDLSSEKVISSLEVRSSLISAMAISPDGRKLVFGLIDGTIQVWDLKYGKLVYTIQGHSESILHLEITPDNKNIISVADDNIIRIRELNTGLLINTLVGHSNTISLLRVTSDGNSFISVSDDNVVRIWDLKTGVLQYSFKGHGNTITALATTLDRSLVVSGSDDNTIQVYDLTLGRIRYALKGHSDWISAIAITPDSTKIISASYDNSLRIWDLVTGMLLHVIMCEGAIATMISVTPDSKYIIFVSNDGVVRVIDLISYNYKMIVNTTINRIQGNPNNTSRKKRIKERLKNRNAFEGEVIYDGKKTDLSEQYKEFLSDQNRVIDIETKLLFHKDDSWKDEKEYRFVFNSSYLFNHRLTQLKPSAIYLGYRMSEDNINRILKYCQENRVSLFMYTPNFYSKSAKNYKRTVLFKPEKIDRT